MARWARYSPELLKDRGVRRIVAAEWFSLIGDFMVLAAMPFAVLSLGGSPAWVGGVLAAQGLSLVVFLPIGGIMGDKYPRRTVMVSADLLRLCSQAVLAALLLTGNASLGVLLVAQVIHGIGTGLFMPAASAVVPDVVRGESVQGTVALKVMVRSGAMGLGPFLGATAVAVSGAGLAMAVDASTFAVSAACLKSLDVGDIERAQEAAKGWLEGFRAWGRQLREGWRDFWALRWMRWTTIQFALVNAVVIAPFYVFGPTASEQSFDGAGSWARILIGLAAGLFVGSCIAMKWRPERPLLGATVVFSLWATPLVALASGVGLEYVVAAAIMGGIGMALFLVLWETTVQTQVRKDVRSRVSSIEQVVSLALVPLGYGLGGWMQEGIGTRSGLLIGATVLIVASLVVAAAPSVRRLKRTAEGPGCRAVSVVSGVGDDGQVSKAVTTTATTVG